MKRKAFVIFTIMTSILMIAYVICLAGPNPPWGVDASRTANGTIPVGGITIHANCYVACNVINTGGDSRTWRTYHWARAYRTEGGNMAFSWTFTHHPGGTFGSFTSCPSPWESDNSFSSASSKGIVKYPYTHIYSGNNEVIARFWPDGYTIP